MRRRDFLLAGAAACCPLTARAQARRRIGVLVAANREPFWSMFVSGLRQVGYVVGENLDVDLRSASGNLALLPQLAAELVQSRPELIVGVTTPTVEALKHLTADIPIVMAPAGDPVGAGFVKSLARPGGNITGVSSATAEFAGKCVELLREIIQDAAGAREPEACRFQRRRELHGDRALPEYNGVASVHDRVFDAPPPDPSAVARS